MAAGRSFLSGWRLLSGGVCMVGRIAWVAVVCWRRVKGLGLKRRGVLLCTVLVVLSGVTGCSGSHSKTATKNSASARVRATWVAFFDSKTPLVTRVSLLQSGSAFGSVLAAQDRGGLMTVTVKQVTVLDSSHASVGFSLKVAPSTYLSSVAGAAVLVSGKWLVSKSTMCVVLAATGQQFPACNS